MIGSTLQKRKFDAASKTLQYGLLSRLGMLRWGQAQGGWMGSENNFITPEESALVCLFSSDAGRLLWKKGQAFAGMVMVDDYTIAKPLLKKTCSMKWTLCERTVKRLSMSPNFSFAHAEQIMHWRRFLHVEGSQKSAAPDWAL